MQHNFNGVQLWRELLQRFSSVPHLPSLRQLLDSDDTTLQQVLNEEDVIQEAKNSNSKLLTFLNSERLSEMITYITVVADDELDQLRAKKWPFVCNEILSCEQSEVAGKIVENTDLMAQLSEFYKTPAHLNLVLAGYTSQVFQALTNYYRKEVMGFLSGQENWVATLTTHLYSHSVANLLQTLLIFETTMTQETWATERINIVNGLVEQLGSTSTADANSIE